MNDSVTTAQGCPVHQGRDDRKSGRLAELNLKHLDKAETNALRAEAMDKQQHSEPRIELLLASIYTAKGTYASAAEHYRAYLKLVPDGPLTDRVKTDLAKTEELAKTQGPATAQVSK